MVGTPPEGPIGVSPSPGVVGASADRGAAFCDCGNLGSGAMGESVFSGLAAGAAGGSEGGASFCAFVLESAFKFALLALSCATCVASPPPGCLA